MRSHSLTTHCAHSLTTRSHSLDTRTRTRSLTTHYADSFTHLLRAHTHSLLATHYAPSLTHCTRSFSIRSLSSVGSWSQVFGEEAAREEAARAGDSRESSGALDRGMIMDETALSGGAGDDDDDICNFSDR